MKRGKTRVPSGCVMRIVFVVASLVFVSGPTIANAAVQLPTGCAPAPAPVQKYPVVRMPNIVGQSVTASKIAAAIYAGTEHLAAVTTASPRNKGKSRSNALQRARW